MTKTSTVWKLVDHVGGVTYASIDATIAIVKSEISSLNTGKIACASPTPVTVGSDVSIIEVVTDALTGSVLETNYILYGEVISYTQRNQGTTKSIWDYKITEKAVELDKFRVHNSVGSYTVALPSQSVAADVATILYDSGWTTSGSAPTGAILPSIQMKVMTGTSALNKVIAEMGAASAATQYYLWFDASYGGSKTVGWGTQRTSRTTVNFKKGIYYDYELNVTNKSKVDGVIIYGAGSTSVGQFPASFAGHKLAVYQYDDATSDAECTALATRIYLDYCNDPKARIQFKVNPRAAYSDGGYIKEGDWITVDSVAYPVTDVTLSVQETLIGVGANSQSVLYQLGDRLKPISGSTLSLVDQTWSPGQQNVSSDGDTWTQYTLNIADVDSIGPTFAMTVTLGQYTKYSYQAATGVTNEYLSTIDVPAYYSATAFNVAMPPDTDAYVPWTGASPYMQSATVYNGFQCAYATLTCQMASAATGTCLAGNAIVICEYSYDTVHWYEGTFQQLVMIPAHDDTADPYGYKNQWLTVNNTYVIPGQLATCKVYVRWKIHYDCASNVNLILFAHSIMLDIIPRHTHVLQQIDAATSNTITANQTDDLSTSDAATPAQIYYEVNGNGGLVNNGDVVDIKSSLVTGLNIVRFKSTTSVACSVSPSAVYQQYGSG